MKYSKAPVSEVIIGMNLNTLFIPISKLTTIVSQLSEAYPLVEVLPPLALEELHDFQVVTAIDPNFSGPLLYRLRTTDRRWLIQIQGNKVYLNWVRLDTEPVGNYVGYRKVMETFEAILSVIQSISGSIPPENIATLDLSYHDRLEWQEYISELSKIHEIMNIKSPPIFSETGYNNIFSRYTFSDKEISGYGFININSATSITNNQLLKLEVNLRGVMPGTPYSTWYDLAHSKHNQIFESIFTEGIKNKWI